jgi:hypothetical protein
MYSHIKNNKPVTQNDTSLLKDLIPSEQKTVLDWIGINIQPRKTPLYGSSSYGIKHILQRDTGVYCTNNQFKDAMMQSGFMPVDEHELNWHYCISKRSPAFDWRSRRR